MKDVQKSILLLRSDAIERGLQELAIVLGWSAIKLGAGMIEELTATQVNDKNR